MSDSWPWRGRVDLAEGPDALRWHQVVRPADEAQAPGIALLGFASDEGVRRNFGRPGAGEGPAALRRALCNLAWHGGPPLYDAGDVGCAGGDLEAAQERLAGEVAALLRAGHRPIVLGGGHETAWGSFLGLVAARPDSRIGIINLDAHFDLRRPVRATSGTPFAQMAEWCERARVPFDYLCVGIAEPANTEALFAAARRLGVRWWLDEAVTAEAMPELAAEIDALAARNDALYLSLDLDVLPAWAMPAVSAPAGRGVLLERIETLIALVRATGKLALADLVELNPAYDADGRGARTAARLVWQLARSTPTPGGTP